MIKENIYTYNDRYSHIECPYCSGDNTTLEGEDMPYREYEERDIECEFCDRKFTLVCSVSYSWNAYQIFLPD